MTTDKLFILLLVILLPLTGCLDIADSAEAEESDDDDNITTSLPMVRSLHIEANSNYTMTFLGDTTLKLEHAHSGVRDPDCGGGDDGNNEHCPVTWSAVVLPFEMVCDSFSMNSSHLRFTYFVPVLGDETCVVTFTSGDYDIVAHFTEASLSAL